MGIAALVSPLLAILFGIIGLVKTRDRSVSGKVRAIVGLSLGGAELLLLLASLPLMVPAYTKVRASGNTTQCANNLKAIGLALLLYSHDNKGEYPPTPDLLLLTQNIKPTDFICPASNDTSASGATKQQQTSNLLAGGHQSYIYRAQTRNAGRSNMVLVYEPMSHHHNGFNALFGDMHVEFLSGAVGQKIYNELQAGQNPPPSHRY